MTRAGKTRRGQALAGLFADDPAEAVLQVLRQAPSPLTAQDIKKELQAGGVARAEVDGAWRGVQRRLVSHDNVIVEKLRYSWTGHPRTFSVVEALDLIARGSVLAEKKAALVEVVRAALAGSSADLETAARQRQSEIDAVRALAELASEVEELTVNEVAPDVMIRQVRAWVKRTGLEPIERSGAETTFDRKLHKPIGRPISDGAVVVVVRPGYVWRAATEDVLIGKAIVEE